MDRVVETRRNGAFRDEAANACRGVGRQYFAGTVKQNRQPVSPYAVWRRRVVNSTRWSRISGLLHIAIFVHRDPSSNIPRHPFWGP